MHTVFILYNNYGADRSVVNTYYNIIVYYYNIIIYDDLLQTYNII